VTDRTGIAGRLAAAFIDSKLTPLLIVASIALGAFAVLALPREEEPQIVVPMIDVSVSAPGATAAEVEQRVTRPMEKLLWEIPGVEYLYSTSSPGQSTAIVRFYVGQDEERALVRLNQKLASNLDRIPPGVSPPIVKARSIDDVPVMALTLWGARYDGHQLRTVAAQLREVIAQVPDVSEVAIIGGRAREVRVDIDPARLAAAQLDPTQVTRALAGANARSTTQGEIAAGAITRLQTGDYLDGIERVRNVVVGATRGHSVLLRDIAAVTDGDGEPSDYVRFHSRSEGTHPAVTLSIAKRKGANAITITRLVQAKLETLRSRLLPRDLHVTVTRDYGETAAEKSNELLYHMLIAVLSVTALVGLVLGYREAAVVLVAIPVTLALTLCAFLLYGYTLNRITLFALIFSIGILVDDAIVVVENVVRHARMSTHERGTFSAIAVRAVDEVGNPTILATLTVVAAILPMAFVGGLMGPYMRPIPVGATAAMAFSLAAAFVVTPWAAVRLLRNRGEHRQEREVRLKRL
jgi:multidrug efflux pump subunit AcrB